VPSGVVVRAWIPEPCPAAKGDSGFTIEPGPEFAIGIPRSDSNHETNSQLDGNRLPQVFFWK
jgi:hypothetical protein